MPQWKEESEEDRKLSVEALKSGTLPPSAHQRLQAEIELGSFTSDLSAREYLVMKLCGYEVIGQVMGSSFFSVRFSPHGQVVHRTSGELSDISTAHLQARALALIRMQQEAALLGATGVVELKLEARNHEWSEGITEFTAVGTAFKWKGAPESNLPFISNLSAQELWLLHENGYWPDGLAMGFCAYYLGMDDSTRLALRDAVNAWEIDLYTQGFYNARDIAMSQLTESIESLAGERTANLTVACVTDYFEYDYKDVRQYCDVMLTYSAVGTAVSKIDQRRGLISGSPVRAYDLALQRTGELEYVWERKQEQKKPHIEEGIAHGRNTIGIHDNFSVSDFDLVRNVGFEPAGLVMGSSFHHIMAESWMQFNLTRRIDILSADLMNGRNVAFERMLDEANELGADGIIDVRLQVIPQDWQKGLYQIIATGTPVFATEATFFCRMPDGMPFVCALCAEDFVSLLQTGYRPISLVMGNCVYQVGYKNVLQAVQDFGGNAEMADFTRQITDARNIALLNMQEEAQSLGAAGVIAVSYENFQHDWSSHIFEAFAGGTAIAAIPGREVFLTPPELVMSLDK